MISSRHTTRIRYIRHTLGLRVSAGRVCRVIWHLLGLEKDLTKTPRTDTQFSSLNHRLRGAGLMSVHAGQSFAVSFPLPQVAKGCMSRKTITDVIRCDR